MIDRHAKRAQYKAFVSKLRALHNRDMKLRKEEYLYQERALGSWFLAMMTCLFFSNCQPCPISDRNETLPFLGKTTYNLPVSGKKMDTLHQKIPFHSLTDQKGQLFRSTILDGEVYIAHFFFTTCPSVCPKTQPLLKKIAARFQENNHFKIVSYSIDPQYDMPERLKLFALKNGFAHPNHIFLTGNKDTIYQLANEHYNTTTFKGVGTKDIAHTGALILIDKDKYIRGIYNGMDESEYNRCVTDVAHLLTKL